MSPICPRCGGELKEVVIFAWKHLYADMEENCGGKDVRGQIPQTVRAEVRTETPPVPANSAQDTQLGSSTRTTSSVPPILRREYFTCPRCGNKKEWLIRDRHPWPGAICRDCYAAELAYRQDSLEKQDERGDVLAGGER